MKVLQVHNHYRSGTPSGENRVVEEEAELLRETPSVDLRSFYAYSDDISARQTKNAIDATLGPVTAPFTDRKLTAVLDDFRPDILHLHNPFPLISPRVVNLAADRGVPVIQTVHNFRHSCMAGTHFRDGDECWECLDKQSPFPAVRHRCYRNSRVQSAVMAVGMKRHNETWQRVSHYLCLNSQQAEVLERSGIPPDRISVKPNSVPDPGDLGPPGPNFLFIGRLEQEKGILLLLEAWKDVSGTPGAVLEIVGDGACRRQVIAAAAADPTIVFSGPTDRAGVDSALKRAHTVVVPSVWLEPFGRVAVEGMAAGRSVIVTERGELPHLISNEFGWIVEPTASKLAGALRSALVDDRGSAKGAEARREYLARFSPAANLDSLRRIYLQLRENVGAVS